MFEEGRRVWLSGDATQSKVPAIDGRHLQGQAYSPFDVIGTRLSREQHSRSTVEFPHVQASLTGLGAVLTLSTAMGLEGPPPAAPGLYLPEVIVDAQWALARYADAGAVVDLGVADQP